ncbi:hypothetical protein PAECIP111892_02372 [Paenibacillus auburnensis]|uniref:Uncharacterized protein n=1 Tax=Paenibacillus auburnensis TaxID=2905649 RepID=A0ABN8GA64_9BACL|nr:hypothetical protein PAECIP111892_02372 [Paenibacillus auburnensis]
MGYDQKCTPISERLTIIIDGGAATLSHAVVSEASASAIYASRFFAYLLKIRIYP